MVFFGLDDSQRVINGNNRFLRMNGYTSSVITVHALYPEDLEIGIHYIWTLGPPDIPTHQHYIRDFLDKFCTPMDVVIACVHYFMYPEIRCLPYIVFSNRREFRDHMLVYNKADRTARKISKDIMTALERGDVESMEIYKKFFFGNFNSLFL